MSQATSKAFWVLAAAAAPLAYVLWTKRTYDRRTTVSFNIASSALAIENIHSDELIPAGKGAGSGAAPLLPPEVLKEPDAWVVAKEAVASELVAILDLDASLVGMEDEEGQIDFQALVNKCLRIDMQLFTRTPQAWFMQRIIKDLGAKKTFSAEYLSRCGFEVGDRVCGVYVVTSRFRSNSRGKGGELVILDLSPPEGWTGPVVQGKLVVRCEKFGQEMRLVNEVLLWRRKNEKPVFLEGFVGRWMHSFMVQWFVVSSLQALTGKS